jgi:hypothetical protein
MPEAYEHGGKLVGVVTTLGFATALPIHTRLSPGASGRHEFAHATTAARLPPFDEDQQCGGRIGPVCAFTRWSSDRRRPTALRAHGALAL